MARLSDWPHLPSLCRLVSLRRWGVLHWAQRDPCSLQGTRVPFPQRFPPSVHLTCRFHVVLLNPWSNWYAGLDILQITPLQNQPRVVCAQHCSGLTTSSTISSFTNKASSTTFRCDSQQKLTWLFGSPSKLHICGTILLSVKLWAPDLGIKNKKHRYESELAHVHNTQGLQKVLTYALSVAIRQRQIPSLVRKFLCLNPPSILSHTYWGRQERVKRDGVRNRFCLPADIYHTTSAAQIQALHPSKQNRTKKSKVLLDLTNSLFCADFTLTPHYLKHTYRKQVPSKNLEQ